MLQYLAWLFYRLLVVYPTDYVTKWSFVQKYYDMLDFSSIMFIIVSVGLFFMDREVKYKVNKYILRLLVQHDIISKAD